MLAPPLLYLVQLDFHHYLHTPHDGLTAPTTTSGSSGRPTSNPTPPADCLPPIELLPHARDPPALRLPCRRPAVQPRTPILLALTPRRHRNRVYPGCGVATKRAFWVSFTWSLSHPRSPSDSVLVPFYDRSRLTVLQGNLHPPPCCAHKTRSRLRADAAPDSSPPDERL